MYSVTTVIDSGERLNVDGYESFDDAVAESWVTTEEGIRHSPNSDLTIFYPPHRIYQIEVRKVESE